MLDWEWTTVNWGISSSDLDTLVQGIIDMNGNGNSANFFSYVCNDKKIKEFFASTLNKIPISFRCVSYMTVIFDA